MFADALKFIVTAVCGTGSQQPARPGGRSRDMDILMRIHARGDSGMPPSDAQTALLTVRDTTGNTAVWHGRNEQSHVANTGH